MTDTKAGIRALYAAFNARDVDGALEGMTEDVSWPKASEGGRVEGKEGIRAYWWRQWAEFDPRVEPVEIVEGEAGTVEVTVHQVVKSLRGEVLSDGVVRHVYTLRDGLMARMEVRYGEGAFGR